MIWVKNNLGALVQIKDVLGYGYGGDHDFELLTGDGDIVWQGTKEECKKAMIQVGKWLHVNHFVGTTSTEKENE